MAALRAENAQLNQIVEEQNVVLEEMRLRTLEIQEATRQREEDLRALRAARALREQQEEEERRAAEAQEAEERKERNKRCQGKKNKRDEDRSGEGASPIPI